MPTWCNKVIYWCILSSTCFGRIRPSSGALDAELQHIVFCTEFVGGWWFWEPLRRSCARYTRPTQRLSPTFSKHTNYLTYRMTDSLTYCFSTRLPQKIEHFREKLWNKSIKILKCRAKFPIALEISHTFTSCSWQYWSNLLPYQLPLYFVLFYHSLRLFLVLFLLFTRDKKN